MSKSKNPYLMLGSLSSSPYTDTPPKHELRKILKQVVEGDSQGKILHDYIALGDADVVLVVELPTSSPIEAIRVSTTMTEMTGISFKSSALTPLKKYQEVLADTKRRIRIRIRD